MLHLGLTGGIGSGKSTVAATFAQCGGVVIDADHIARTLTDPTNPTLEVIVDAFGSQILTPDHHLDRAKLARIVFTDSHARQLLDSIMHPRIAQRRDELLAQAHQQGATIVVEDIPLLVEKHLECFFPLVIVVAADRNIRLQRLHHDRGMPIEDIHHRMEAQASDEQRWAVADIWITNNADRTTLRRYAQQLWHERLEVFAHNLRLKRAHPLALSDTSSNPDWSRQAQQIITRLALINNPHVTRIDHVGPTSLPRRPAPNMIDIQISVDDPSYLESLTDSLAILGFFPTDSHHHQEVPLGAPPPSDQICPTQWQQRLYHSADPGRPAAIHVRVQGHHNQEFALLVHDWLTTHPDALPPQVPLESSQAYRKAWQWAHHHHWCAQNSLHH